jgi:VWFA-related protein
MAGMPKRAGGIGLLIVTIGAALAAQQLVPQEPFVARLEIARLVIDARVVDSDGRPVSGLTREDFEVKIGGKPVRVESAEWIGEPAPPSTVPVSATGGAAGRVVPPFPAPASAPRAPGRLIVFLIQKDLRPLRAKGLLRWLQVNEPILAALTPEDRAAVVSFDSHLKIWLDFTNDVDRLRTVLVEDVMFKEPASIARHSGRPSLVERLTQEEGRKASTVEDGLRLVARALEPLPGSKSIVLVGWGFGRLNQMGTIMLPEYDAARDALQAARATLLCLDVTFADSHSLSAGLEAAAADTGGMVDTLYNSPRLAIERIVHALSGYYELFAEKPPSEPGLHEIAVTLTRAKGTVLARRSYTE